MKAIIVEDEQSGLDNLLLKLNNNCPGVDVVACCRSGEDAIKQITALQPDLIFLDINLGSMSGFDVLERLQHVDFEVIFTTAYDQFALRAIKNSALDFLLKPVDEEELKTAVQKAWGKLQTHPGVKQIAVPDSNGLRILKCDEIIWCEADNNNTQVYLTNSPSEVPLKVPRSLSELYLKLPRNQFFKVHRKYIVNRNFVEELSREGFVYLKNKKFVSLARSAKDEFMSWLGA